MNIATITPPQSEPFEPLDLYKALRLESDEHDQYATIASAISSARHRAEAYLRRRLITQTVRLTMDQFPFGGGAIAVPIGPVQSVAQVVYVNGTGSDVTLGAETYTLSVSQTPNRLVPAYGKTWPVTRVHPDAVKVDLVVGYGDTGADIPADILQAIRLDVAHLFHSREAVVMSGGAQELPLGFRDLLAPHRFWV